MANIHGTDDDDRLEGTYYYDDHIIYGYGGDDIISTYGGDDYIYGGDGNDDMSGGENDDYINGGDGNDKLSGGYDSDTLYGGNGSDKLYGGYDNDSLYGEDGDDTIESDEGDDLIYGGDGNDKINVGGYDTGNDTIYGGNGDDILESYYGEDYIDGGNGNDWLKGTSGKKILYGGDGNDLIEGGTDNDTINGGNGDDIMWGHYSNDTLSGGLGNDIYASYRGDKGHDIITEEGSDQSDILVIIDDDYTNASIEEDFADLVFSRVANTSDLKVTFKSNADKSITIKNGYNLTVEKLILYDDSEYIFEKSFSDILNINTNNTAPKAINDASSTFESASVSGNVLTNDTDANNDILTVSKVNGNATKVGTQITLASGALVKLNTDGTYSYNPNGKFNALNNGQNATDSFTYETSDGKGGTSTATVTVTIKGQSVVSVATTGDDKITTFDANDTINALAGNDTVKSGNGNDTVRGGDGNDIISAQNGNDKVYGDNGNDTINLDAGDDYGSGGSGNDAVRGGDGNDTIYGGNGNDKIYGDNGNDIIYADSGDDYVSAGSGNDTIYSSSGIDTLWGNSGNDKLVFTNFGHSTKTQKDIFSDFKKGQDKIDFSAIGIDSFTDLKITKVTSNGSKVNITTGDNSNFSLDVAFVDFVTNTQLSASDFIFDVV